MSWRSEGKREKKILTLKWKIKIWKGWGNEKMLAKGCKLQLQDEYSLGMS